MRRLIVLTLAAVLACGDETAPLPSLTGAWRGVFSSSGVTTTLPLTLTESGTSVAGSGNLASSNAAFALTATGTHAHPNVSLVLGATGFQDINLSGEFTAPNTVAATLNGSGYVGKSGTFDATVTHHREPR